MLKTIYAQIEASDAREPTWIVGPKTAQVLHRLVRVVQPEFIMEIGTSVGYSALHMAEALELNGKGFLWTIESHEERFSRAQQHFEASGLAHRIHSLKAHAPEVFVSPERWGYSFSDLPPHIDFLFLDATKYQHPEFLETLLPRLSKNAYVLVDNTMSHRKGRMKQFVEDLLKNPHFAATEIATEDGLVIARFLGFVDSNLNG